jgi:spermidine synthase
MAVTRRAALGLLCACFFLSGATGLVYEVVWLRLLGLVFGHTVYAITTVLAAFMAGLGLGSYLFGRRAARFADPVRVYGALEIGIGIYCALLPALLWLVSSVYPHLYRLLSVSYTAFGFVQFLLVAALLLIPTTLMGGTLPILTQAVVRGDRGIGQTVGLLYAVNTFGAVIGVAAAGYFLLPAVGNRVAIGVAAAGNVAVGVLAIWYSRALRIPPDEAAPAPIRSKPGKVPAPTSVRLIALGLGVSGAVSMVYEVAWTRGLALVIGSSTYAFSAMLVAFLVGIAGGAALYSWLWGAHRASATGFALIQVGIGLTSALVLLAFDRLPEAFLSILGSASARRLEMVQLVVSAGSLLAPTLLIGASFPCALSACASTPERAGEETGRLYAVNTLGAIVGTVLAGFVLVPAIGIHTAVKAGIVANLAVAIALSALGPRPITALRWATLDVALVVAGIVIFIPGWDLQVMSSGPAIHAVNYLRQARAESMSSVLRTKEVLFYQDGASATVSVTRSGRNLALRVNGKPDASTDMLDMQTQLMIGHLPLLLHRDPKSVLMVGLGSGVTAGAVARHPIERLEVVEIEPAVVAASSFFARENRDVLKDPKVRLLLADARNFFLTTPERYDVIISEPSNPWIGGIASLFTREAFQLARSRLQPGGVMAQWLQSYSLLPEDLKMIVRTFQSVFPNTSIWHVGPVDYVLIGTAEDTPIDLARVKARYAANEALRVDFARSGVIYWPGMLGFFILGGDDVGRFADGAALNTDDRLRLEFTAPRGLYLDTSAENFSILRSFRTADLPRLSPDGRGEIDQPAARTAIGYTDLWRKVWDDALAQFRRALELDPTYTAALVGTGESLMRLGRPKDGLDMAQKVLAREPKRLDALYLAGLAAGALDDRPNAIVYLEQASALAPDNEDIKRAIQAARRAPAKDGARK